MTRKNNGRKRWRIARKRWYKMGWWITIINRWNKGKKKYKKKENKGRKIRHSCILFFFSFVSNQIINNNSYTLHYRYWSKKGREEEERRRRKERREKKKNKPKMAIVYQPSSVTEAFIKLIYGHLTMMIYSYWLQSFWSQLTLHEFF